MPNDSIESLFEDAVNASENPNEGKDAAKFITAAPKPKIDENELRLQQQREEEIRLMKQKEEMERQEAIKRAEEKRKAEAEAKNAEEKAKREAQERLERQRQEQIEKDRKHQAELLRKQQEAEQIKLKEQQEKEQREQALKEQEEKRLQEEENKRIENEKQLERQRQLEEEQRKARLKGNPFAVENVSLVLTVSDSYRGYDLSSQEAVKSFFNEEDEATIISAVLNETNEIRAALHSLILAQQAEQVDRAFLLVSLDVNLLTNMGKIMSTYTGADLPISALPGNRIEYCRALEKAISSMSTDQQSNLEAIQRLLAIPTK